MVVLDGELVLPVPLMLIMMPSNIDSGGLLKYAVIPQPK